MNLIYLAIIFLHCTCAQRSRYSYYDPYYQYYGRYYRQRSPSRSVTARPRTRGNTANIMQKDQPVKSRFTGPNVCYIKEVLTTGTRFYLEYTKDIPNKVCKRMTFYRRKCCSPYMLSKDDEGCSTIKPLHNLVVTARKLGLYSFVRLLTNTELGYQLANSGSFTLFVPTDTAFRNISHGDRQRLHPWTYNAPSLLHYHVTRGRHNYSDFKDSEIETLYYGKKYLRINKYRHGIVTVNCARIGLPNKLAQNGIIHVIDRMLKPMDILGDISSFILRDPRFTQFARIIYAADMVNYFRSSTLYTLFVPDDQALGNMPKELSTRIFSDRKIARAIVSHHTVEGTYCASAILTSMKLQTNTGGSVKFTCRFNGVYVDNARIKEADQMVENGVVHIINKVLLPNIVKTSLELLRDNHVTTLVDLIHRAGHRHALLKERYTLFAPSDAAFDELPAEYLSTLKSEPGLVEKMINYHTVSSSLLLDNMIHGQRFDTAMPNTHIKVSFLKNDILINDAHITSPDLESSNAVVHIIDKVLVPPEHSLLEVVRRDPNLSDFSRYAQMTGVSEILLDNKTQKTVFAPTNEAFKKVDRKLFSDRKLLKQFLLRHVANQIFVSTAISEGDTYTLQSIQSELIKIKEEERKVIFVNKHSKVIDKDQIASNGFLFTIDQTIYCKCRSNG